jgi:hypothetical protein
VSSVLLALAHCMTAEAQAAAVSILPDTVVLRMLVEARRACPQRTWCMRLVEISFAAARRTGGFHSGVSRCIFVRHSIFRRPV